MLILLSPYKFTEFHFIFFELDVFEKKLNDKFEIHDLSKIVNPAWEAVFKLKRHKKVKKFDSINEWVSCFRKLNQINKNIIVFNLLDVNTFKSLIIQFKLNKYCKRIIQLDDPGIPNYFVEKKSFSFDLLIKKIITIIKSPKSLIFFLKTKLLRIICRFIRFDEIFVLHHGTEKNFVSNFKAKKKFFIKTHSPDYSRLISYRNKKIKLKKPIVIFLDAPGPYFKNDYDLFQNNIKYDISQWYGDLNNFLLNIKKVYSCEILIIPHPKVKRLHNPFYSKEFKVCHDLDAVHKFIPISKFVISIAASTATGLACACNKPIIFIYNNQLKMLNPGLFEEVKFISNKYKTSLINLNKNYKRFLKPVNSKHYKKVLYKYLTSKEISSKKNYEIFNDILKFKYN